LSVNKISAGDLAKTSGTIANSGDIATVVGLTRCYDHTALQRRAVTIDLTIDVTINLTIDLTIELTIERRDWASLANDYP
jgi:hypothetical protein